MRQQNQFYQFVNKTKSTTLATKGKIADNWYTRARGLLFSKPIEQGEGLFLTPCNSIHMFGMTYAIDAVFVDKHGQVIAIVNNIKPWQISSIYWRAESCLELPPGTARDTKTEPGDQLEWH